MEGRFRKLNNMSSVEITPPILTRRRLSAPETIMRKHTLAQQRSSSQESDRSQNSESTQSCNWPFNTSSESNLRKKDIDIRKSTLMKRFWESSKTLQFPRTYAEWQYSFGKMKLGSNYSTPEHVRSSRKNIFESSPSHRRRSPDLQTSPKRKPSTNDSSQYSLLIKQSPELSRSRKLSNESFDEYDDSFTVYSSKFSNTTWTVSPEASSRPTDAAMSIVLSESAHSQSLTTPIPASTESSDSKNNNNNNHTQTYEIHTNVASHSNSNNNNDNNEQLASLPIQYQFVISENSQKSYDFIPKHEADKTLNESATQTVDRTNLNVITNVQLSQSTLNLIFKKVMQDVILNKSFNVETPQPTIINVKKLPSFTIPKEEVIKSEPKKTMSEISVGSPYKTKPTPPVPRLSALPKTSSMEVNISSNESFDKESETASLVDSLDDPQSPRNGSKRDTLSLLPDNSDNNKVVLPKKPSVFYIPIENEETSDLNKNKDMSELLPTRLKERLLKRQLKREQKIKENNLSSFSKLDIENGNVHPYFTSSPELARSKASSKKKKSTILPIIDNKRDRSSESDQKSYGHRSCVKNREVQESHSSKTTKSFYLPKRQQFKTEKIISKTKRETTRKYYQKTENCKEIEILEIMEIVEPERIFNEVPKLKSKIPIPINKQPKMSKDIKQIKPSFLDFDVTNNDPKLDQLIANILIDTLNRDDLDVNRTFLQAEHRSKHSTVTKIEEKHNKNLNNNNPSLIEKAAEILTNQVLENNNLEKTYFIEEPKLAESIKKELDNANIPKGWITFYMLQKSSSPDSTSDEGPQAMASKSSKSTQKSASIYSNQTQTFKCHNFDNKEGCCESDSESEQSALTYKQDQKIHNGGWSVTVSGETNCDTGPNLEMKLKFPMISKRKHKLRNRDVGIQKNSESFPPLSNKISKTPPAPGFSFEEVCTNTRTTEINKSKQYLKRCEAKLNPRPTKTSKQRYLMNRGSYHRHFPDIITPLDTNRKSQNSQDTLEVNGNAVHKRTKNIL